MVSNIFTQKKSQELKNKKFSNPPVTPAKDPTSETPKSIKTIAYDTKSQILVAIDKKYLDWFGGKKLVSMNDLQNAIAKLNAIPLRQRTSDWTSRLKHYQTQLYLAQKTKEGQNKK